MSVQLSSDQKTRIHEFLAKDRLAREKNANFSISVGTKVPRAVRVHDVSSDLVTIVPQWRGYKYVIVQDEIVIIDPQTLEIVAVVPT